MTSRPLVIVQADEVAVMTAPLAMAAAARGYDVYDVSLSHPRTFDTEGRAPILIYGSVALLHHWAAKTEALRNWTFWDEAALSPDTWASRLGNLYLNADGRRTIACEVPAGWYARPMRNAKAFTGGLSIPDNVASDTPVWAAPAKRIDAEVRVFIVGGKPVAASTYQVAGQHVRVTTDAHVDAAVQAATHALRVWTPLRHCVADLALSDGVWRIIEFNCLNTSAWYAVDPGVVLDAFVEAEG
ncbi:ATP-grasp domain-containing protein [uncultured Novosphingobium sp.]|uniref:ATP-grasp domain-containing protein n=1 Tax=uncultured Novosphingobium sp. TaxID=292277 RepID=UPI00374941B9